MEKTSFIEQNIETDTEAILKRKEKKDKEILQKYLDYLKNLSLIDISEILIKQNLIITDLHQKINNISRTESSSDSQLVPFNKRIYGDIQEIQYLKEDWDEQGASPFNPAFLNYIFNIITNLSNGFYKSTGEIPPVPAILPVIDGSIDVHWKKESYYDLLINFDPESEDEITFVCNIQNKNRSSNTCTSDNLNNVIIPWMKKALTTN